MTMYRSDLNSTENPRLDLTQIDMEYVSFCSVNGPLIILNLTANIFFVFCLTTHKTQQVKQPVKILLAFAVSTAIIYLLSVPVMNCIFLWDKSPGVISTCYSIVLFMMNVNMSSYVWLMFYYYIKIVPSQRALFLWVKQNVKSVIYIVLFVDRLVFLCNTSLLIGLRVDYDRNGNGTVTNLLNYEIVLFSLVHVYIFLCLFIIMISCFATAHYLNKHMKHLVASGGSIYKPRNQIRVIVTGIIQGVVYFFYSMWFMLNIIFYYFPPYIYFSLNITFTITSVNVSITTANLAIGQTLFRERAVHVWKAVGRVVGGKCRRIQDQTEIT